MEAKINRNSKHQVEMDIKFLRNLQIHAKKWDEDNDLPSKQSVVKMIDDWYDELVELRENNRVK